MLRFPMSLDAANRRLTLALHRAGVAA